MGLFTAEQCFRENSKGFLQQPSPVFHSTGSTSEYFFLDTESRLHASTLHLPTCALTQTSLGPAPFIGLISPKASLKDS